MPELAARYAQEYANARIKVIENLLSEYGDNSEYPNFPIQNMKDRVVKIKHVIDLVNKGYITNFEAVKSITQIAEGEQ